jgi:hypothetical protein
MSRKGASVKNVFAGAMSIAFLCGVALLASSPRVSAAETVGGASSGEARQPSAKQKMDALWNGLSKDEREAMRKVVQDSNSFALLRVSLIALLVDGKETEAAALVRSIFPALNDRSALALVEFFSYANRLDRSKDKP